MKISDVKVGMRVVPNKKSYYGGLDSSVVWQKAKEAKQPYLYVTQKLFERTGKAYFCLSNIRNDKLENGEPNGDFFLASDFKKFSK